MGSFVIDTLGWQWAFYLDLPLDALSLWRGATVLKEAKRPENRQPVDGLGLGVGLVLPALSAAAVNRLPEGRFGG